MQGFEDALREEQARINAVIQAEIAAMPELVRPVAAHTLNAGGKRLRPLLAVFMGKLFGVEHPDIYSLATAIEFFHVATLIHDDFLDNASTRRGNPAAHTIYAPVHAILGGDVMLAHAARMVARVGNARVLATPE
jgi:Geranylgeranyl pyrophosphate synthase